jgi:hypothetical protein
VEDLGSTRVNICGRSIEQLIIVGTFFFSSQNINGKQKYTLNRNSKLNVTSFSYDVHI